MIAETTTAAEHELAQFLARSPLPEEIITFRLTPSVTERFYTLVASEQAGSLTEDERQELDSFTAIEHFMRLIKAEAHKRMQEQAQ